MREFSISLKEKFKRLDLVVLVCVLLMNTMSIIVLLAMAPAYENGTWYVEVQLLASVVSLIFMFVIAFSDYDTIFSKLKYVFFGIIIVLILIVKFFGKGSYGNDNWISIGPVSVQPTEIAKVFFLITLSMHAGKLKDNINHPLSILQLLLHAGLVIGLVLWQGDTGMALVYSSIVLFVFLGGGVSIWYFLGVALIGVALTPILWSHLTSRQQIRILAGFNPDLDPQDGGYQAILSRNTIISGGFRGAGFYGGTQFQRQFGSRSDFIFSTLAEKFGFLGTTLYVVLMFILIMRILWLSGQARIKYASLICIGAAGLLIAQTVENIGMCLAMLPVVGITLPFLSYGPSSILASYMVIGIVQSICVYNKKYYFERELE